MADDVTPLLKPKEAANHLRVSVRTVYSLIARGRLRACRIGCGHGVLRVHCEDLESFIRHCRGIDHPPPSEPPSLGAPDASPDARTKS